MYIVLHTVTFTRKQYTIKMNMNKKGIQEGKFVFHK